MNKLELLGGIQVALEAVLKNALDATALAKDTATHEENIAENKYDTLGLEAAYLAHGQAERVAECEADLEAFNKLIQANITSQSTVAIGALITTIDDQESQRRVFLATAAGGLKVDFNGETIVVITPSAPLGRALMGRTVGDEIELAVDGTTRVYEITHIC